MQAPDQVLRDIVAFRLHIDDCGENDGALRFVPGSHMSGRLSDTEAIELRDTIGEVVRPVSKGGALLLRPLTLHASSKATGESRRRVLHFVYAPRPLPSGLRWHREV